MGKWWSNSILAVSVLSCSPPAVRQQPIDESDRVILAGNTRNEVRTGEDLGALDDETFLHGLQLQLKRSPEQEAAAEQLADEVNSPGSSHFHQWVTVEQYAEHFGASSAAIEQVSGWLESHGLSVDDVAPSRLNITFSGTAAQLRTAFNAEIHALNVNGVRHIANVTDPSIPRELAPVVEGVVALHDFFPKTFRAVSRTRGNYTDSADALQLVVPGDLATIYNLNPLFKAGLTGRGQTIALIEDSDLYATSDWPTFRSTFDLDKYKAGSLKVTHPGGCEDPGINPNGDDIESSLDVDWAGAAAPEASLEMAACANTSTTSGILIAIQNVLNRNEVPSIISVSYGECEPQNGQAANAAFKAAYLQAVLEGTSVFVATGDTGGADCDDIESSADSAAVFGLAVDGYTATPYNVSVGGTDFADLYFGTVSTYWANANRPNDASALSYIPEIPWNDSCSNSLNSSFFGYDVSYGASGFCNDPSAANEALQLTFAGGGGPSSCATGVPTGGSNDSSTVSGTCKGYSKPWWQHVAGNPADGVRDVPDLALFAGNGIWGHLYVYCDSDPNWGAPCEGPVQNWALAGGTSFATPIMAGIQALVNQKWGDRQGNPNPVYYALAEQDFQRQRQSFENGRWQSAPDCNSTADGGPSSQCIFHDITLGDNVVDCAAGSPDCYDPGSKDNSSLVGSLSTSTKSYQPAFNATPGWDFATGLGSINAANLVNSPAWSGCH